MSGHSAEQKKYGTLDAENSIANASPLRMQAPQTVAPPETWFKKPNDSYHGRNIRNSNGGRILGLVSR
jgi:hypothetical protein